MKRPTAASLKRVTPQNLATLGPQRLADLLFDLAESRPELKRRLRMELAAEQGAEALILEIDKRLAAIAASRARVSWRRRPTFVGELKALGDMIAERLAPLDVEAGRARLWAFLDLGRQVDIRVGERRDGPDEVFARAAQALGGLLAGSRAEAERLAASIAENPKGWDAWLPLVLAAAPQGFAAEALIVLRDRRGPIVGKPELLRRLADAAGDVEAYSATYSTEALRAPAAAAQVARRYLQTGRTDEAGVVLQGAAPRDKGGRRTSPDFEWEGVWIDYLEATGDLVGAQAARWASFERTLSVERAKAFTRRLTGFDDVEAEEHAFALAAIHPDFESGLRFLMDWPALLEAGQMIRARADEAELAPETAELWAGRLAVRQPTAAYTLLRKAASAAFRRRDLKTCERLTQEAEVLNGA